MIFLFRSTVRTRGNAEEQPYKVKDPLKKQPGTNIIVQKESLPTFRNAGEATTTTTKQSNETHKRNNNEKERIERD